MRGTSSSYSHCSDGQPLGRATGPCADWRPATAPVSSPAQIGTVFDGAEIILLPGEAILVYAEANTTNWQHLVILEWKERT